MEKYYSRKSIRLKGYDYSQSGIYFVTICCQNGTFRFGDIESGTMVLNELGQIAQNQWTSLSKRYTHILLDEFVIMPNHVHAIVVICHDSDNPSITLGNIIGSYKSLVTTECLKIFQSNNEIMGKLWQRNYYEHIIRSDVAYQHISNYIQNNPQNWDNDCFRHS